MVAVNRAGGGDPVKFFLHSAEGGLGRFHIAILNGRQEVLGAILEETLPPAVSRPAGFILPHLLLASIGIGHEITLLNNASDPHLGAEHESRSIASGPVEVNQQHVALVAGPPSSG